MGKKITLVKYGCEPKVLGAANKSIKDNSEKEKRYDFAETHSIAEPELLTVRILDYFGMKMREFDTFKNLDRM